MLARRQLAVVAMEPLPPLLSLLLSLLLPSLLSPLRPFAARVLHWPPRWARRANGSPDHDRRWGRYLVAGVA
eukprot:COSAG06_NODE_5846_length_3248_cov_1.339155_4_plen_72_part_00